MGPQIAVAGAFLLAMAATEVLAQGPKLSAAEHFRNYALSTCLADGYQAEEVNKDAAAAARGYLELGGLPLEAHTEATQLGRDFLKREYASSSGQPLVLMKCLDLHQSQELQALIRKYMRKR